MTSNYAIPYGGALEWDDLRTFLAIARHKTLTAAARTLGVTQPTMGRRLAAMEERVGARLLVKMPGGYAITPLGDMILASVERIEREVEATSRLISGSDVSVSGLVRLTTIGPISADIVTPALCALNRRYPDIAIDLVTDARNLSLSRREADLALRVGRFNEKETHSSLAGRVAFGIYGTADWGERIAAGEARVITLLDDQAHLPEAHWIYGLFPQAGVVFRSNSRSVLLKAAVGGIGLAVLPRYLADAQPQLVRYCIGAQEMRREMWLGVHNDMRNVPRLKLVIDSLIEAFRDFAPILDPPD